MQHILSNDKEINDKTNNETEKQSAPGTLTREKLADESKSNSNSEQLLAEEVGRRMFAEDKAAQSMGISLDAIAPGYAKMSMKVREDMLNGFAICHGGITFTLGDTAFAYACNSRNQKTVALSCNITFATAVKAGETLTATAQETVLNNRTGLYDIVIRNQNDAAVAFFRGNSYCTKKEAFTVN
jgi:acyl-CoA thioesterase